MNNKLDKYIEYLYVTGELDKITLDELVNRYNQLYGELPIEFFQLESYEQTELLESALKCKSKIIKM